MPTKKTSRREAVTKKKPTRTKVGKTFLSIIVDESGSMFGLKDATIQGVNTYLDGLKGQKKVFVTLTKFSTLATILYAHEPLEKAQGLTALNYLPNGGTALNDAIGQTTHALAKDVTKDDRVLVVIVTDGQENASKAFSKADVKTLITTLEGGGNWTFTFLAANLDVAQEAKDYGFKLGNTVAFQATAQGVQQSMQSLSSATANYMSSTGTGSSSLAKSADNFYSQTAPEPIYSGKPKKRVIP